MCASLTRPMHQPSWIPYVLWCVAEREGDMPWISNFIGAEKRRAGGAWKSLLLSGERLLPLIRERVWTHTNAHGILEHRGNHSALTSSPHAHYKICDICHIRIFLKISFSSLCLRLTPISLLNEDLSLCQVIICSLHDICDWLLWY